MSRISFFTKIAAPPERVFDLSRSIDLHVHSQDQHREKAIAGVTSGLIGLGQEVTWHAKHWGFWHNFTAKITLFKRPHHFKDEMIRSNFKLFKHDHFFELHQGSTLMIDELEYVLPLGILGKWLDRLLVNKYLKNIICARNRIIKYVAETAEWKNYLVSQVTYNKEAI